MVIMKFMTLLMAVLICRLLRTKSLLVIIHHARAQFLMLNAAGQTTELTVVTIAADRVTLVDVPKSPTGLFLYLPISWIYHNICCLHRLRRPQRVSEASGLKHTPFIARYQQNAA